MKAMILKEFRELSRDRRTSALVLIAPLLLLMVFGYAANFSVERTGVLLAGPGAKDLQKALVNNQAARDHLHVEAVDPSFTKAEIEPVLRVSKYDAVVYVEDPRPTIEDDAPAIATYTHLWIDGSQLFAAQAATGNWMKVISEDMRARAEYLRAEMEKNKAKIADMRAALNNLPFSPESLMLSGRPLTPETLAPLMGLMTEMRGNLPVLPNADALPFDSLNPEGLATILYNPDLNTSWVMVPGLIGLIMAFIGTIVTSIGLVREREAGTLEQLAVMPLRPAAILIGKIAPYFLLALIDLVIITILGVFVFDVPFRGSLVLFALAALIFLFVVLGLGILVSSVSQTTGQAIQLALLTMMPQVLLSGIIFPLALMATPVRVIGYLLPLTWFNMASQGIMLRDASLTELALPFGIMVLMAVVIFGAATLRMGRILRRGGATR